MVSFKIGQEYGTIENAVWLPDEKRIIETAIWNIAVAYARGYNSYVMSKTPSAQCLADANGMPFAIANILLNSGGMGVQRIDPTSAFLKIHDGQVTFSKHDHKYKKTYTNDKGQVVTEELDNYGLGPNKNSVYLYPKGEYSVDKFGKGNAPLSETNFIRFATHEMGHVFDHAIGDKGRGATTGTLAGGGSNSSPNGFCGLYSTYQEGWQWRASDEYYEYFADMFTGWVYGCWESDPLRSSGLSEAGELRSNFMNENMPRWIYEKIKGR